MEKKAEKKSYKAFAGLIDVPFYPINYVKVMMQIGHEPLPPFKSTSIFGHENLYYPNTFSYLRYIYSVEGITGLYRGLGMRIVSNVVGNHVYGFANRFLDEYESKEEAVNEDELTPLNRFLKQTSREVTTRCWAILFSHPFHVMALRCMAQFVGGETKYSSWNVFSNSVVIYKGEGLSGFFSGLIPRLLYEASSIAITNLVAYLIKTYLFDEKEVEFIVDLCASTIATSITYPLSVVSTVSTIAGCGLIAGQAPRMIYYASWIDVFKHLNETNQLKRGSSMFFRLYNPVPVPKVAVPQVAVPQSFKLNISKQLAKN